MVVVNNLSMPKDRIDKSGMERIEARGRPQTPEKKDKKDCLIY